jgi:pimeloyl-ACP methyl ester carboxylesterase
MPTKRVGEANLHYIDEGRGSTVLLLLHAFPLHSAMWRPQIEALRGKLRIIAPDARGLGGSGEPPDALTMSTIAEDAWQLLDDLGVGKVVVCGLSMGGYAAFELYRRAPEVFAGLVLADTRAPADTPEGRAGREAFAASAMAKGMTWVADEMVPKLLRPSPDPAVAAEVRRIILENEPAAVAAAQRGMALRADSTPVLASITAPTLVIVGRQDKLTPPSFAEEMAKGIRGATLEVLDGAGHLANLEAPGAFTAALERFAGRL